MSVFFVSVRNHTCKVYFVTYIILSFMHLQLGSVCEGILWSDSRPVEEERKDEDGGSRRKKVKESERGKTKEKEERFHI